MAVEEFVYVKKRLGHKPYVHLYHVKEPRHLGDLGSLEGLELRVRSSI